MAAYISTYIYGNESFGGYVSVDGKASVPVQNEMIYQIEPGPHHIEIFSTSDAKRKAGRLQASVYCNTSSSGALFDALERREALKNLGNHWTIDVFVGDNQMLVLSVRSQGDKIVGSPAYGVDDITEEQSEALQEMFEELEEERCQPKRSKKKIVWGIILTLLGIYSAVVTMFGYEQMLEEYPAWTPFVVIGGFLLIGILLLIDGFRKKSRV